MFLASCLFVYGFGRVAHWTTGVQTNIGNFCQWDCGWYSRLIRDGYNVFPGWDGFPDEANWAFFPLFPISAKACQWLLHLDVATATVLASRLEYFTAILSFLVWMRPHLESLNEYFFAAALVALNPYLIYGHAGYTEPLYFTLCCLGFWALERQKWILAGVLGACLSATRLVGLLFAVVYAIVALRDVGWRYLLKDRSLRILIGLAMCPLGLVLYSLYLYHHMGDALAFVHVMVAWGRTTANPLGVMARSYQQHGWFRVWSVMALASLLVSAWLVRRRAEYGIFLAISILIAMSSGLLWSFPRYLWWQPPLLYVIFFWLRRSVPAWMIYLAFAGAMASFMVFEWFTGNTLVV